MQNQLNHESSPYLLQHADNPVHWQSWNASSLALAKEQDKPILLSIGYSTCHWCHVMAHESFEDEAIAAVMNAHFVNIKVDREERPDLDKIYQMALQLITNQNGGWPLTMFLDAQTLLPFFGGTYFPDTPRYQLPGFSDLLLRLKDAYDTKRQEVQQQGVKIQATLDQMMPPVLDPTLEDLELLQEARDQLGKRYDSQYGGFGNAPKFPTPTTIERLMRHWSHSRRRGENDKEALDMVMTSLTQMARGGIYDHLGGGFCRYSTDRKWMIPHFEKMLYDNGQLLSLYSAALSLGPDVLFSEAITQSIDWLVREMLHEQGGFYAAQDADSQGEEGKYYVWRREQVKQTLTEQEYLVIETLYGLDKPANFENKWNFHRHDSWRSVAARLSLPLDEADQILAAAKQKLFKLREERVRPGTDTKILTAWNGLLIRGLADAAGQFDNHEWLTVAQRCVDFLRTQCWHNNTLYATWQDGQRKHPGYLDDYANLLEGLLSLLSTGWREEDARFAQQLARALLDKFYDKEAGGFYFTEHDHEQLIHRPKPTMDDALPPGNGSATRALLRIGHLLGQVEYLDVAHKTLRWARAVMERVPAGHCTLLSALEETVHLPQLVILRGPEADMKAWQKSLIEGYTPWRHTFAIPYAGSVTIPQHLPKLVSAEQQAKVTAYVCSGLECSLPITSIEDLKVIVAAKVATK